MLTITTLFLFAVFFAAEFYRFRHRINGSVREIHPLSGDATGLAGAHLQVITSSGEITAFVSGCQLCVHPVVIGETVSLVPGPDGYVMHLSWFCRRKPGPCAKTVTP